MDGRMSGDLPKAFNGHRFFKGTTGLKSKRTQKKHRRNFCHCQRTGRSNGKSVSQDEIHTENTANQKGKPAILSFSHQSSQEHVAEVQNSTVDNVQGADNVITNDITEQNTPPVNANGNNTQSAFRMEKPRMLKFSGDVREFAIFKVDFKHLVEARYSKRDSITILRASLNGKPLELIKGIGHDYDATWEHVESIYGDP